MRDAWRVLLGRARPLARPTLVVVAAGAVAVAALGITSRTEGAVSVGRVELRLRAGSGGTELALPPLGRVSAPTHEAPFRVRVEVQQIDLARVEALAAEDDPAGELRADAAAGFEDQLRRLAVRVLGLSALVGLVVGALAPGRRWRDLPLAALGGAAGAAMVLGSVWRGYDVTAFERSPRFHGALEHAPSLLATIERHVGDVDVVRERVGVLGARIADLYSATAGDGDAGGGTRILHVSDIHSNPLGVEVVHRLVENFDVDAVLDSGDLTSFGSALEVQLGDLIAQLDVPYLLVPGNHDSPSNRTAFESVPRMRVLDREVVTIGSVRILGVPDPTFTADNRISTAAANAMKLRGAADVRRLVRRHRPDVLAVHDLRHASEAAGDVDLVLAGHVHERSSARSDGTLLLTVGSTGATGLGSFTADSDLAYEAQVLHFRGGRLTAVDYISLEGFSGGFTVDHMVVPPEREQARDG